MSTDRREHFVFVLFFSLGFLVLGVSCASDPLPGATDAAGGDVSVDLSFDTGRLDGRASDAGPSDGGLVEDVSKGDSAADASSLDAATDARGERADAQGDHGDAQGSYDGVNLQDGAGIVEGGLVDQAPAREGMSSDGLSDGLLGGDATICPTGYKYCAGTSQCIPLSSCCVNADCSFPRVCNAKKGLCVCTGIYSEPNPIAYACWNAEQYKAKKEGSCVIFYKDKNCLDVCGKYRCMREVVVRSASSVNCKKPDGSWWDLQTVGNSGYPDVFAVGWASGSPTSSTNSDDCDFVDLPDHSMGYYDMDITNNTKWKVRLYDNDGLGVLGADWMATFDDVLWRKLAPGKHTIRTTNSAGGKLYKLNITINAYK